MTLSGHERTRELIAMAGADDRDLSDGQQAWLRAHLRECAACRDYAEAAGGVVRALRSQPWAADSALVRATQMRVRARLLELQQQRERVRLVCVSCFFVGLSSAITTPFFWRAFEWMGVRAGVSNSVWQAGFAFFGIVPALVVSTVLLACGTHWTSARWADNGEKQWR